MSKTMNNTTLTFFTTINCLLFNRAGSHLFFLSNESNNSFPQETRSICVQVFWNHFARQLLLRKETIITLVFVDGGLLWPEFIK